MLDADRRGRAGWHWPGQTVTLRGPTSSWGGPDALRRAARPTPGMLADPDQMPTAMLRVPGLDMIPDPLRTQMRTLTGVAGDRYVLVRAGLAFTPTPERPRRADLTVVITDVRLGTVGWRTVAQGEGDDLWSALWDALQTLVPDLP